MAEKTRAVIGDFAKELRGRCGDELVSLILYGSAASGEFAGKQSDINMLVVLKDTGLTKLRALSGVLNSRKFALMKPLFFTEEYIARSLDVFPIEFLDIKENYTVVYGKDVVKDMRIDTRNLRFQCEQELRSKLINIKSLFLKNKDAQFLRGLLFKSLVSLLHIMRNVIRLKGKLPPYEKEAILGEFEKEFKFDASRLRTILTMKNGNARLDYKKLEPLFFDFVGDLEEIVNLIDRS